MTFLDLRGYMTITAILCDFHQNGINIFNNSFHEFYYKGKKSFVDLKQPIELLCDITSNPDWKKDRDANNSVKFCIGANVPVAITGNMFSNVKTKIFGTIWLKYGKP